MWAPVTLIITKYQFTHLQKTLELAHKQMMYFIISTKAEPSDEYTHEITSFSVFTSWHQTKDQTDHNPKRHLGMMFFRYGSIEKFTDQTYKWKQGLMLEKLET